MEHHATLSPSALPMLSKCQLFERGEGSDEYRDAGNRLHKAFGDLLLKRPLSVEVSMAEKEKLQWAAGIVNCTVSDAEPLEVEQKLCLMDDSFKVVTFGTADVLNGRQPWVGDLKTMDEHDYWYQMACYALMKMQRDGGNYVEVDVYYTRNQRIERLVIGRQEAIEALLVLFAKIRNPHREPVANEFCKWCKHITTCPAVSSRLVEVVAAHDWLPASLLPEKLVDPADIGKALAIASLLSDWIDAVELRGKTLDAAGVDIPGWRRKVRQGNREITDAIRAYELSGLPPEAFYPTLKVTVGAIEEAIAKYEGIPLAAAKIETNLRLAEVITQRPPTTSLVPKRY
jgi:hypothetical protein